MSFAAKELETEDFLGNIRTCYLVLTSIPRFVCEMF